MKVFIAINVIVFAERYMMRENIPYAKQVMLPAVSVLEVHCQCGYVWAYRGVRQHASCPRCRSMVTLHPKRHHSTAVTATSSSISDHKGFYIQRSRQS
jgi:hypothetical protein